MVYDAQMRRTDRSSFTASLVIIAMAAWLVSGVALSGIAYAFFVILAVMYGLVSLLFGVLIFTIPKENLNFKVTSKESLRAWVDMHFWQLPLGRIFVTSFGLVASLGSFFAIYAAGYTALATWLIFLYMTMMVISRSLFNSLGDYFLRGGS